MFLSHEFLALCSLSTHEDHTIKDLCSDDDERSGELDQLFADHMESTNQQLARLITIQDDFNMHMDRAGDKLNKHHDDVIKHLKQQHKSFRAQLQQRRDKVNQNLEKSKTLIQQGNDCVNNLKRQSASWRRPIPGIPAASITDKQDLIEGIKQQLPTTDVPLEEPCRVVFLPSDLVSLGNIIEGELKPITQPQRVISQVNTTWKERVTHEANTTRKDGTKPKQRLPVAKKNTEPNVTGKLIYLEISTSQTTYHNPPYPIPTPQLIHPSTRIYSTLPCAPKTKHALNHLSKLYYPTSHTSNASPYFPTHPIRYSPPPPYAHHMHVVWSITGPRVYPLDNLMRPTFP